MNRIAYADSDPVDVSATGEWFADLIDEHGESTGISLHCTSGFPGTSSSTTTDGQGYEGGFWSNPIYTANGGVSSLEFRGLANRAVTARVAAWNTGLATRQSKYTFEGVTSLDASGQQDSTTSTIISHSTSDIDVLSVDVEKADVDGQYYGFLSFIVLEIPDAEAPPVVDDYAVVVLAGQSNMVGQGTIEAGIDDNYSNSGGAKQFGFASQVVSDATNPLQHASVVGGSMGSWLTFANTVVGQSYFNKPILFVPVAMNGTGFGDNTWNPGDAHYEAALASINAALSLSAGNTLEAFIWHQGENDSGMTKAEYKAAHNAMIADLISRTSMTTATPILMAEIRADADDYMSHINDALNELAVEYTNGYCVDASDLTLQDSFHYDNVSLRKIGQRFAGGLTGVFDVTLTAPYPLGDASGIAEAATGVNVSVCSIPDMTQVATNVISWSDNAIPSWTQNELTSGVTYNVTIRDDSNGNTGSFDITAV